MFVAFMEKIKLIIAGGRDFADYALLKQECSRLLSDKSQAVEIVSGKAKGADALGEQYSKEHHFPVKAFYPDWKTFGRAAGPIRNQEMANYATHLIAFWDGKSRGTKSMINLAAKQGLCVKVVKYSLS